MGGTETEALSLHFVCMLCGGETVWSLVINSNDYKRSYTPTVNNQLRHYIFITEIHVILLNYQRTLPLSLIHI